MAQDMTGYPGCQKVPINVAVEKQTAHRIQCEWWLDLSAWMTDEMEGSASVELSAQEKKKKKRFLQLHKREINIPTGTSSSLSTGTKSAGQM